MSPRGRSRTAGAPRTRRSALALYTVLLVLPTLVLGGLSWRQIEREHRAELAQVPFRAEDAAARLLAAIQSRLDQLLAAENERGFYEYADLLTAEEPRGQSLSLMASPLRKIAPPPGILAWFGFDRLDPRGAEAPVEVFFGGEASTAERVHLAAAARAFVDRQFAEPLLRMTARMSAAAASDDVDAGSRGHAYGATSYPLAVAAVHRGQERWLECLGAHVDTMRDRRVDVLVSPFHLQFYLEDDGTPRCVATRRAVLLDPPLPLAPCLAPLANGFGLLQGFFLDPQWLFDEVPYHESSNVLGEAERFLPFGDAVSCTGCTEYHAHVALVSELRFETPAGPAGDALADYGAFEVAIDTRALEARFHDEAWRFLAIAAMLVLSLTTGMGLLLRSVNRELEQARRTQNFVAAVTHELRTPLAGIRLHGEMLLEGWVDDEEQRREYYRRIVRETDRLGTLVERVLTKSRLSAGPVDPLALDLGEHVRRAGDALLAGVEPPDLELRLAPGLPRVWLTAEAVEGILVNLVENARKYAPVDPEDPDAEPILVSTRVHDGHPVLEVSDRGPGVPPEEAEKVFEAFYRIGNEATRTSKGTGLGLHLVDLHARSVGGRASVHRRPGGGAVFRVSFRRADQGSPRRSR